MFLTTRKGLVALLAVSAGVLSACGGGGASVDVSGGVISAGPQQVSSRVQPADAVQDVSPMRVRVQDAGSIPKAGRVALGPLAKTQAQVATVEPGVALQVGETRSISQTASAAATLGQFQWQSTAEGGQVGAISFASEGATGVRLGVLVRKLPGGAMLRVYSQSRPGEVFQISGQEVLQRIDTNLRAGDTSDDGRTWWTPYLGYADATLEVELPAGTRVSSLDIAVPRLSHIFTDLQALAATDDPSLQVGESLYCQLDANCYTDLVSTRNAVARMIYVKDGGSYLCTGTLLNDRESTGTPYFISANHCISTQTVASSLQTDWFYRSATCGSSSVLASSTKRYGGATLLYAASSTDTSFMRLNETPPAGVTFAGWTSASATTGVAVSSLHHPKGDLLKYSNGGITGFYNCNVGGGATFSCTNGTPASSSHYLMTLNQGITEGGSSGSGIFSNGYMVGVLSGGSSTCGAAAGSNYNLYGRFDLSYAAGLNQWLWASSGGGGSSRTAIYRFYNSTTGAHFFTPSADERDYVISTNRSFAYEGVAFYAPTTQVASTSSVFRFYNRASGAHFYTISSDERDYVLRTQPTYQYEGPVWYGRLATGDGATPIYRFYNAGRNVHFYTINAAERDYLIANNPGYKYEGPVYYAWTSQ